MSESRKKSKISFISTTVGAKSVAVDVVTIQHIRIVFHPPPKKTKKKKENHYSTVRNSWIQQFLYKCQADRPLPMDADSKWVANDHSTDGCWQGCTVLGCRFSSWVYKPWKCKTRSKRNLCYIRRLYLHIHTHTIALPHTHTHTVTQTAAAEQLIYVYINALLWTIKRAVSYLLYTLDKQLLLCTEQQKQTAK